MTNESRHHSSPPRVSQEFLFPSKWRPHYLERVSILEALRKLRRHARPGLILDVGCGVKPYENLFELPDTRYLGTDYPVTMKGSYGTATRADFFSDSLVLPFPEESFDTLISTQVLEHVDRPEILVPEMARVLKPGGTLLLSAPMTWPLHEEPHDYYRYTIFGLRHLLEEADFEVLDEVRRGNNVTTVGQMILDTHLFESRTSLPGRLYSSLASLLINQACRFLGLFNPGNRLCLGWAVAARKPASPTLQTGDTHQIQFTVPPSEGDHTGKHLRPYGAQDLG